MRIFFVGSVQFSRKMLEGILTIKNVDLVGIATKSKSSFNSDHDDLSDIALANNIPYKYVKDINAPHIVEWISNLSADIIYCLGWSSLIKQELLSSSSLGVIGYHPAELPQNRGRHPLIWALVLGLKKTASTFFFMDNGADTGDIISQESIEVLQSDDASTMYKKIEELALIQIKNFTKELSENNGIIARRKQDHIEGNYWRKRGKNDGRIDFRMSSEAIYNLIRGLTKPYVGAHLEFGDQDIKVWSSEIIDFNIDNYEPGKVLKSNSIGVLVKTYDGAILLTEHEFETLPEVNTYL